MACMGQDIQIRVAHKEGVPIAGIITLRHGSTVVYKYGCSDEKLHHLAAMPFLFWQLIEESKEAGAEEIDLGRTDMENKGLTTFKDRFGTTRTRLIYFRYPENRRESSLTARKLPAAQRVFSVLPLAVSSFAGRLLYKHIG